jgi:hypothetical protein
MKVIPETCLAHYIFIIAVYFVHLLSYMLTVGRVWSLFILKYIETWNGSTLSALKRMIGSYTFLCDIHAQRCYLMHYDEHCMLCHRCLFAQDNHTYCVIHSVSSFTQQSMGRHIGNIILDTANQFFYLVY